MRTPRFTDRQKAERKATIKIRKRLDMLDAYAPPSPPPLIIHHPRAFNPPLSCLSGKHGPWETGVIMGIPRLKCKKCGRIVMKGSYEGTETQREIRTRNVPKPEPPLTIEDMVNNYFSDVVNKNDRR